MKVSTWIIGHDDTSETPYMLECTRCGATQTFTLPIRVDYWVDVARAFKKAHRKCRGSEIIQQKGVMPDAKE